MGVGVVFCVSAGVAYCAYKCRDRCGRYRVQKEEDRTEYEITAGVYQITTGDFDPTVRLPAQKNTANSVSQRTTLSDTGQPPPSYHDWPNRVAAERRTGSNDSAEVMINIRSLESAVVEFSVLPPDDTSNINVGTTKDIPMDNNISLLKRDSFMSVPVNNISQESDMSQSTQLPSQSEISECTSSQTEYFEASDTQPATSHSTRLVDDKKRPTPSRRDSHSDKTRLISMS